jgi:hypothetical protein
MNKDDRSFLIGILLAILFASFVGYMAYKEQQTAPTDYVEFSPSEGVKCIKVGHSIGCWREEKTPH